MSTVSLNVQLLDQQLLQASLRGDVEEVGRLLSVGASLEAKSAQQTTPLAVASYKGHAAVVSLLLGKGASVDARDAQEFTPLHAASQRGHAAGPRLMQEMPECSLRCISRVKKGNSMRLQSCSTTMRASMPETTSTSRR